MLSNSLIYHLFGFLIGSPRARRIIARDYFQHQPEDQILDLGCGTGITCQSFKDATYIGLDASKPYIQYAKTQYPSQGTFYLHDITTPIEMLTPKSFDLVVMVGVLHHLSDEQAQALLRSAAMMLKTSGRCVCIECCYHPDQSRLARWIVSQDRGRHQRKESEYADLANEAFGQVQTTIRHDLLRIPYTHCILQCKLPINTGPEV